MRPPAPLFSTTPQGLKLSIRLTPKSSRDALGGLLELPDGRIVLKARVRVTPEKGKANEALIRLIAKSLDIPRACVTLAAGRTSRTKILLVDGDTGQLKRRIKSLIANRPQEN